MTIGPALATLSDNKAKSMAHPRHTVVVKIGTSLLADKLKGINVERIESLAKNVTHLRSLGKFVAIVSSGAIGAGVAALGLQAKPRTIPGKQATAAVGQPLLMEAYERAFRSQGLHIGQLLLTKDDLVERSRFLNAKNTFSVLFEQGVIPIVNENDTVAVEEIKLGDNDNLAAMVANLIEAEVLIILTNTGGLYSSDPTADPEARLIPIVNTITPDIERLAKKTGTDMGTGGMVTKLQAAKRCTSAGIPVVITDGTNPHAVNDIFTGSFKGTLFLPTRKTLTVRKRWIGFVAHASGYVIVDDGARLAIMARQKSLLPSGILEVHGDFNATDTIAVRDTKGGEIARGVSAFSSLELERVKGRRSKDLEQILNRKCGDEVIHKNNLVIMGG